MADGKDETSRPPLYHATTSPGGGDAKHEEEEGGGGGEGEGDQEEEGGGGGGEGEGDQEEEGEAERDQEEGGGGGEGEGDQEEEGGGEGEGDQEEEGGAGAEKDEIIEAEGEGEGEEEEEEEGKEEEKDEIIKAEAEGDGKDEKEEIIEAEGEGTEKKKKKVGKEEKDEIIEEEPEIDTCVEFISGRLGGPPTTSSGAELVFPITEVPDRLRQFEKNAYEPDIISIGPYHRGNSRLQVMEKRKLEHLKAIAPNSDALKELVKKLKPLEKRVRRCYSSNKSTLMTSNEFLEMMLVDSCFIVHLLREAVRDANDLRGMLWVGPLMFYDLLLLENQLPFFLVQFVYDITDHGECSSSLVELVYKSYCLVTRKKNFGEQMDFPPTEDVQHLLHLYHWFHVYPILVDLPQRGPNITIIEDQEDEGCGIMIPNATDLHELGIKLRRKKACSILDVEFTDGILKIPHLCIYDGAVSLFRNLIAFEQSSEHPFYLSDYPQFGVYFKFMDHIINTDSDVKLLQKNGIIEHSYGSEKEIANLFNELTRGATINANNYLSALYKKVNEHCTEKRKKRHIWWAILVRRHCSNPWAILSLIGVLILLLLTFLQTYFSIFSYFRPRS